MFVNATEFVKVYMESWLDGTGRKAIAERLGISVASVTQRTKRYTQAGVKLPPLGTSTSITGATVDQLNEYIAAYLHNQGIEVEGLDG